MKTSQVSALIVAALILGLTNSKAFAATEGQSTAKAEQPSEVSERSNKKYGAYLGILGDPAPTIAGLNAAYNLNDFMRMTVGLGQFTATTSVSIDGNGNVATSETKVTTLGAGAKFMVPKWNFTPVAGLNYSHVFVSGDGDINVGRNNVYANIGLDWQTASGFNLGLGFDVALTAKGVSNPYLNIGWFM